MPRFKIWRDYQCYNLFLSVNKERKENYSFVNMNLLPEEIIPTVLCYAVCGDYEDEDSAESNNKVDIAICNSNGYLMEISNKKIVNSCYILIEDATKLIIYYKFIEDTCIVYYLAKNSNGVMIVVRKLDNMLLVVKCYRNVKDCKIFDYNKKGYPQIGLHYLDNDNADIIELSEFDNFKLGMDGYFSLHGSEVSSFFNTEISNNREVDENMMEVDELIQLREDDKEKNIIKDYLSKKLRGIEIFTNELNYELYNLNLMFKSGLNSEFLYPAALTNTHIISSEEAVNMKITRIWYRIHNCHWILGIEFWRFGVRDVDDIGVLMRSRHFTSCTYKFFDASDTTARISKEEDDAKNKEGKFITGAEDEQIFPQTHSKSIAVFALEIPDFGDNSKLSVSFTFSYEKYQHHTETFHLGPENLLLEKYQVFGEESEVALSEDLLACLVVNKEIDVTVEMRYNLGISLEEILIKNLGFKMGKLLDKKYFIKESGYLGGTSISIDERLDNFIKWKLSVAVRDLPRLKILVKALYNELPMPVRIRVEENLVTGCGA